MTDAAYLCSRTGKTYPLDPPLWRAPSGAPLLVTDLPGIRRDQIDTATRSLWRYRAAFPIPVDNPISLGEAAHPSTGAGSGGGLRLQARMVLPTGLLQGPGGVGDDVDPPPAGHHLGAGGQLRQWRSRDRGLRGRGRYGGEGPRPRQHLTGEGRPIPRLRSGDRPRPGSARGDGGGRDRACGTDLLRQPQLAPLLPARHQDARL